MILRLLRARVIPGEEERLARFVRDEAVATALKVDGLLSFQPAVRRTRAGSELVIVSTWSGFDDLVAVSRDVDSPMLMPDASRMLADAHAEHYELVIGEARAMPLREGKLRLARIQIKPNLEAAYYEAVRNWADRLLDEAGMVAFILGRRVVGRQDETIAAQLWQDEAKLREAARLEAEGTDIDSPMGGAELSTYWAAEPAIEHFDALTAVEPRPNAPAILITDDRGRYVHATPAAAELSGRPLARLLTMRVEDVSRPSEREAVREAWERFIAEGSMDGPYKLARPDGSEVDIRFASKANAPWPGSHAWVLVPSDEAEADGELDVDEALAEAGFVARYSG